MKLNWIAAAGAALAVATVAVPMAEAQRPLTPIERARVKARIGEHLTPREREMLRRHAMRRRMENREMGWRYRHGM